jgi:hypothetical protein
MTRRKRAIDEHYVRKASDETVNNSADLQNDNDLLFPVGTNETWAFNIFLIHNSGTTPDIKFAMSVPSGASSFSSCHGVNVGGTTYVAAMPATLAGTGSNHPGEIHGVVRTGGTSGNVILQWAQNIANSSDTKIIANSILMAWRVD